MTHDSYLMNHFKLVFFSVIGLIDPQRASGENNRGFTLVELLVVVALIGILATMSIPTFNTYVNRTKNSRAMSEIRTLGTEITAYTMEKGTNPPGLAAINRPGFLDPWKRPYEYVNIAGGGVPLEGPFGVTLNKDYDLYSTGVNGISATAFGVPANKDDIVRFNDGSYTGIRE